MTRELPTIRGTRPGAAPAGYVHVPYVYKGTVEPPKRPQPTKTSSRGCSVDGCARDHHAKGLCSVHYRKVLRGTAASVDARRRSFDPSACGTVAGYSRHRNHGIPQCQPCRDAKNAYDRQRYAGGSK